MTSINLRKSRFDFIVDPSIAEAAATAAEGEEKVTDEKYIGRKEDLR